MSRASWTRADLPTASGAAALWRVATLSGQRGGGIPIGVVRRAEGFAPWFAPPEHSVLVLGPPRSGKTSAIVIPAVIAAPGPVVSTSTKRDVLDATAPARSNVGPCLLYDPLGGIEPPAGVEPVGWTPLHGCDDLDRARARARVLVLAAASTTTGRSWQPAASDRHWLERAEALLAPLLYAAALDGASTRTLVTWVELRDAGPALSVLDREGAELARDQLLGVLNTEEREQSGIWSTASGALGAYRSESVLASTEGPVFDPWRFLDEGSALYVCATARQQAMIAPLVVGLIDELCEAAYERSRPSGSGASIGSVLPEHEPASHPHAPVGSVGRQTTRRLLLALDEAANIAPLPDLPGIVSEGGGQGVTSLVCLQDLSQARVRWGPAADGFLSLFGTTVVLPGIEDLRTLQLVSALAGEREVAVRSVTRQPVHDLPPRGGFELAAWLARRALGREPMPCSVTTSVAWRPRLAVDQVARGWPGHALVINERASVSAVALTPWHRCEPWRSAVLGWPSRVRLAAGRGLGATMAAPSTSRDPPAR
jgi:type IV secretion system protein VirD4